MRSRGPASSKAGGSTPARNCSRSSSMSARNRTRFDVSMKRVARKGETILPSPRSSVLKSGGTGVMSRCALPCACRYLFAATPGHLGRYWGSQLEVVPHRRRLPFLKNPHLRGFDRRLLRRRHSRRRGPHGLPPKEHLSLPTSRHALKSGPGRHRTPAPGPDRPFLGGVARASERCYSFASPDVVTCVRAHNQRSPEIDRKERYMDQKTSLRYQLISAWCGPAFLVTFVLFWG